MTRSTLFAHDYPTFEKAWAAHRRGDRIYRHRGRWHIDSAHENPLSHDAKIGIGLAAGVAALAAGYALYKHFSSSSTQAASASGSTPAPTTTGSGGAAMQWVPLSPSGASYSAAPGTYRATAQTSGNVSISTSQVASGLEGQGLTNVTVYAPGDSFPADWPDQRQGQNLWRVEATVVSTTVVPVSTTKSFLLWSGTVTILSLYTSEPASTTPKVTWTVTSNGDTTAVDLAPNDILRVIMPPLSGAPDSEVWSVYETGQTTAVVLNRYEDPTTLNYIIDLQMQAGQGTIVGQMQAHTPNTNAPTMNNPAPDYEWTIVANVAVPQV
jgi:hypothetical protein